MTQHIEPRMVPAIHAAVKSYFQQITLPDLWAIGVEELEKRQAVRLFGKRAVSRVLNARNQQRKKGRKPHWPSSWMIAPGGFR